MPEIRPVARHDRHGLIAMANAHIGAVLPGGSIPVATLLSQIEYDTDEYIVEPWVTARATFVAIEAERVVAAAHLKRYRRGGDTSSDYDDAGVIEWLLCWPDHTDAGREVLTAALECLRSWGVRVWYADGNLPCLGVSGIPSSWPHISGLLEAEGFAPSRVEVVFAGDLTAVAAPGEAPLPGIEVRRVVGALGTAFEAVIDGEVVGAFEVDSDHTRAGTRRALAPWADEANHWVRADRRGQGIGSWLFRHGCAWLRLGGKHRLLAYADLDVVEAAASYYARHGMAEIERTERGWSRMPGR